jgi:DNA-binding Xre family transcriptional regulator
LHFALKFYIRLSMIKIDIQKLNKIRKQRGTSMAFLARTINAKPQNVVKFLSGGHKKLDDHLELLDKLCNALGCNWKDIIK